MKGPVWYQTLRAYLRCTGSSDRVFVQNQCRLVRRNFRGRGMMLALFRTHARARFDNVPVPVLPVQAAGTVN